MPPLPPRTFLDCVFGLATLRVLNFGPPVGEWPFALHALAAAGMRPEHRQVQVVVTPGGDEPAARRWLPEVLAPVLEGLTMRDLRTGQALVPLQCPEPVAEAVSELLQPDVVIHLAGHAGTLTARLLYRLSHPRAKEHAAAFHGTPDVRAEASVIEGIGTADLPAERAGYVILDEAEAMIRCHAGGRRLRAITGGD